MAENNNQGGFDWIIDQIAGDTYANLGFESSKYDFTYRVFPENLGNEENSHYMILNINVPVTISGTSIVQNTALPSNAPLLNQNSKVDSLRFAEFRRYNENQGGGGVGRGIASRRIAAAVALHMPNSGLVYTEDNKYEAATLSSMVSGIVSGASTFIGSLDPTGVSGKLLGRLGTLADGTGSTIKNTAKIAGTPINPMVEVIFTTRPQRQWMFEVLMAPRTQTEAEAIREIIRTIRYYAAPELQAGGFVFIPPAEFDITFYRNGEENTYLPRINTCVLEKIDIDYAPADGIYATFSNGAPVAVRMSLGFREIEINHKARVLLGF